MSPHIALPKPSCPRSTVAIKLVVTGDTLVASVIFPAVKFAATTLHPELEDELLLEEDEEELLLEELDEEEG